MTEAQKFKFYFPAWNNCCRANGWHTVKGQVVIDQERLTVEGRQVLALARQRSQARGDRVKLDDLRHAAHIVALGKDKSSEHLTNAEVDRVVCLFKLLTDPEDLDAVMKWQAYQRGEDPGAARRVDYFISHAAPDGYVRHISEDKFGSRQWEWLTPAQKNELARTLKERQRARMKPMQREQTELTEDPSYSQNAAAPRATGAKTYQLNPHKTYTKGPF